MIAESLPPCGGGDCEPGVKTHCDDGDCCKIPSEFPRLQDQLGCFETNRQHTRIPQTILISKAVGITWKTIEESTNEIPLQMSYANRSMHDSLLGSPIDSPCQTSSLPFQMELHIHRKQMLESLLGHFPDRSLRNRGKDRITEFCK